MVSVLARRLADSATSVIAPPHPPSSDKRDSSSTRLASLHAVFEQPVVVFPAAPSSPHVLIARLGCLTLRSSSESSGDVIDTTGDGSAAVVHLSVARASLSALNIADNERGVPRVRGTSEAVQAMLILAHYLLLVASPGEHCVLEDISADFMVVSIDGGFCTNPKIIKYSATTFSFLIGETTSKF